MLRRALASAIVTMTIAPSLRAQANEYDPSGTWTVHGVPASGRGEYAGEVTISRNGGCYAVAWSLESGERYRGVGMVVDDGLDQGFAVAWGGEGTNGVVFYVRSEVGDTEWWGQWCQPNGRMGVEDLGPPFEVDGTHALIGGDSGTGTVTFTRDGNSETNFGIRWETSAGSYAGFGSKFFGSSSLFAGSWGSARGGISLFRFAAAERLVGLWAVQESEVLGSEELTRR